MKKRVAILKGGDSVEREVSLSTGQSCSKALNWTRLHCKVDRYKRKFY